VTDVNPDRQTEILKQAVRLLADRCPRLKRFCYWAGTASIAVEELHHRQSFDLDFHTKAALQDVRPILAEIQAAFLKQFEVVQVPDEFGSGFQGVLTLPGGERITVEVLSNYEDVSDSDLVEAQTAQGISRVSMRRYLADKIQCVAERAEARDLADIRALLHQRPDMQHEARELLAAQDAALAAERLMAWTDDEIEKDLKAYVDVDPADAREIRDMLLKWLKSSAACREDS